MKKGRKKGFTLIELMIVLAIIAILAVVLVPKASLVKTTAKLSGLDTNERMLQADIEGMLGNYGVNDAAKFESDLMTKLSNSSDYKNPITNTTGMDEWSNLKTNGAKAIGYYNGDNANQDTVDNTWGVDTHASNGYNYRTTLIGMVMVCAYPDTTNNQLLVKLIPFDDRGYAIQNKVVTIK